MLLESMISAAIVSILGIGMGFATAKAASMQRFTNVETLALLQLRTNLQSSGFTTGCDKSTNTPNTTTPSITIAAGASLATVSKSCTVASRIVSVNGTASTISVLVPQITFTVTDSDKLGNGNTLTLQNF
jgi:hypothetical protein